MVGEHVGNCFAAAPIRRRYAAFGGTTAKKLPAPVPAPLPRAYGFPAGLHSPLSRQGTAPTPRVYEASSRVPPCTRALRGQRQRG